MDDQISISMIQEHLNKYLINKGGPPISKDSFKSSTSNLRSDSIIPDYKSLITDTECGFHLCIEYANIESTVFLAKSFLVSYTGFGFLDEHNAENDIKMLLALFSGGRLIGRNKIKWNNNYKSESLATSMSQLYYIFYMLVYFQIIKITADKKINSDKLKVHIIKRILNAFEPEGSHFPEYKKIDDYIKVDFDDKKTEKNGLKFMLPPKKPTKINFEQLTKYLININLYNSKTWTAK
jgi:hypothetical protein